MPTFARGAEREPRVIKQFWGALSGLRSHPLRLLVLFFPVGFGTVGTERHGGTRLEVTSAIEFCFEGTLQTTSPVAWQCIHPGVAAVPCSPTRRRTWCPGEIPPPSQFRVPWLSCHGIISSVRGPCSWSYRAEECLLRRLSLRIDSARSTVETYHSRQKYMFVRRTIRTAQVIQVYNTIKSSSA